MTSFVIFCGLLSGRLTRVGRQDLLGGAVVQELLICASGALVLVSGKPTERLILPVSGSFEVWRRVLSSGKWLRERAWAGCLASLVAEQLGRACEGGCGAFGAVFGLTDPSDVNGRVPERDLFGGFDPVSVLATLLGPGCVHELPVLRGWRGVGKLWICGRLEVSCVLSSECRRGAEGRSAGAIERVQCSGFGRYGGHVRRSALEERRGGTGCGIVRSQGSDLAARVHLKSGIFLSADVAHREQAGSQLVSLESSSLLVGRALSVDLVDLWESSSTFFARQRGRCRPCSGDGSAVLLGLLFQCSAVCNPCGFTFGWMHRAAARAPFGDLCSLSVGQPGSGSISA